MRLRLRPPDGPARAARPHRPGLGVRDPRDDVPAVARPPARAGAAAQAVRHRRPARPQDRPGHLHLRRARLARGRRRRATARPAAPAGTPRPVPTVGVVGTGTMASGIVEVCARAGYDVVVPRPRRGQGRRRAASRSRRRSTRRCSAARSTEDERDAALARITGTTDARRPAPTATSSSRPSSRTWPSRRRCSARSTRSCKPGAVLATTTSSLPVIECATATSRPQDVVGMHWFNPATVCGSSRSSRPSRPRPTSSRPCSRSARRTGKHAVHVRRPRRVHRQRAAVPLPQRRREDARGRTTRPSTTSTWR